MLSLEIKTRIPDDFVRLENPQDKTKYVILDIGALNEAQINSYIEMTKAGILENWRNRKV